MNNLHVPMWLEIVAWSSIALGIASAIVVALDIGLGHRQHMWIMNVVWPLTALYSGLLGLAAHYRIGTQNSEGESLPRRENRSGRPPP